MGELWLKLLFEVNDSLESVRDLGEVMHDLHLRRGPDGRGNYLKPSAPYVTTKHEQ